MNLRRRRTRASMVFLPILLAACAGADGGAAGAAEDELPEWRVAPEPSLSIGVLDGDAAYQLHQVGGAARLPDGNIAVVNSGSSQLRIYDAAGTLVSQHGRAGEGPGEFRAAGRLYMFGDTIGVYDTRLQRMSLHAQDGTYLGVRDMKRTSDSPSFAMDEWLYQRSWVDGPPLGAGRAQVKPVLAKLPAPDTMEGYRYVRVTPHGHLWVRERTAPDSAGMRWRIYDMQGGPIGRVTLPRGFVVHEFGDDYLLGVGRDAMDVEYVQVYGFEPAVATSRYAFTASPADFAAEPPADTLGAERRREMLSTIRMMATHQELHYSMPANQYRYATDAALLTGLEVAPELQVEIVRANEQGWVAVVIDRESGAMCGMGVGFVVPAGWGPGQAKCQ